MEHFEMTENDQETWRLIDTLRSSFKNHGNWTAEETWTLFKKELEEWLRITKENPKEKTLWARHKALQWIAEDIDWKFARTPDHVNDAPMKQAIGSQSAFKKLMQNAEKILLTSKNK